LWWANQKHWAAVKSYLLHAFLQVHSAAEPFTSHGNLWNYAEPKLFSWVKPAYMLGYIHPFYCAGSHTEHCWRCSKLEFTSVESLTPWVWSLELSEFTSQSSWGAICKFLRKFFHVGT
jgi:hypothetical protein